MSDDRQDEVKFKLDNSKLQDLFIRTFLESLTPEAAQEMMNHAAQQVLSTNYEMKRIMEAVCHKIVLERMVNDEKLRTFINGIIDDAVDQIMNDPENKSRQAMVARVAMGIAEGVRGSRY